MTRAHLSWSGCVNARDIGGLAARGGRAIRHGALIRSEALHHLDPQGVAAVRAHGVGRIIDLRSDWELDEGPHPFEGSELYQRIPWIDDERDAERDPDAERTVADLYRGSLDRNTRQIAAVVRAIVDVPDGPVVVHCRSGKDRTGLLVALLLDMVGVPRAEIAADYAISEAQLATRKGARTATEVMSRTLPETILEALEHVDREYGGVRAYLERCGVVPDTLDRLTTRLLAD